jgi:hypothetical protein
MSNTPNLNRVGIRTDEEEPIIPSAQPQFVPPLQDFNITHSGFGESVKH